MMALPEKATAPKPASNSPRREEMAFTRRFYGFARLNRAFYQASRNRKSLL